MVHYSLGTLVPYLVPLDLGGSNRFLLFHYWLSSPASLIYSLSPAPSSVSSAFITIPSLEPSGMNFVPCWDPNGYRYRSAINKEEKHIINKDDNKLNLSCIQRNENLSNNEIEFLTHSHGQKRKKSIKEYEEMRSLIHC